MSRFWKPSSFGTIALNSTRPAVVIIPALAVRRPRRRNGSACWRCTRPCASAISISATSTNFERVAPSRPCVDRRRSPPAPWSRSSSRARCPARLGDRTTVRRLENVVRRQHEQTALELRLERQRHVHGHLVTVEVGVERRADERVNTDGLAFDEHRLERLDAQSVERRRAVQQHRVIADDLLEDLVHLRGSRARRSSWRASPSRRCPSRRACG